MLNISCIYYTTQYNKISKNYAPFVVHEAYLLVADNVVVCLIISNNNIGFLLSLLINLKNL